MVLLTDLATEQIQQFENSKKKKNLATKKKKKNSGIRKVKNKEAKIKRIFMSTDSDIERKKEEEIRMRILEEKEKKLEEEATNEAPSNVLGIANTFLGQATNVLSNVIGMDKSKPKELSKEVVADEIKGAINKFGEPSENPGFFTSLGRRVAGTYTSAGKGIVNSVLGTKEKANNIINNVKLKQCDAKFVNNFDTFFLSCDRPDLITIYNHTVEGLKKNINHFDEDTRIQISTLQKIDYKTKKLTQSGGPQFGGSKRLIKSKKNINKKSRKKYKKKY